jgi:hypothetical protein
MSNGASQSCESGTGKPSAPIFDFADEMARIKMGIKTTTCGARDYLDLRRQLEQVRRDIVDNNG